MPIPGFRQFLFFSVYFCLLTSAHAAKGGPDIPAASRVQPAQLAAMLNSADHPLVLQVGSHTLFQEAHIRGAIYAGPASRPEGLALLRRTVDRLNRNAPIVIYCGCCPWTRCPNIRPAYRELVRLGYTHVKALYLEQNFGTNWIQAGYAVTHGDHE